MRVTNQNNIILDQNAIGLVTKNTAETWKYIKQLQATARKKLHKVKKD